MMVGRPLIRIDSVSSTMDMASALALEGASSGTTVLAGHQTAGRGRSGRVWDALPWSALLLSYITRTRNTPSSLGPLSLLTGLAVARTVDAFVGGESAIKWPNDVLVEGRKISGVLIVSRSQPGQGETCLITGIGLNVNNQRDALPDTATSLALELEQTLVVDRVLDVLLANISQVLGQSDNGNQELLDEINRRLAFRGEQVRLEDGDRVIEGRVHRVSPDGALEIENLSGEIVRIISGELTRGPQRIS